MNTVYILSEGERYEGERVIAVYNLWADAFEALKLHQPEPEYTDAELTIRGDIAILESGIFYTIIRPKVVL